MRAFIYSITLVSALAFALNWDASGTGTPAMSGKSDKSRLQPSDTIQPANDLRGVYYKASQNGLGTGVGRIAVLLLTEGSSPHNVNLHHRFHTGESFRFIVSSNQDGWLYILHRSPGGEPQLLWPRVNFGEKISHLDFNRVEAGRETTVPASPGKFTFDDEVGHEYFYAVIRPERRPPELSAVVSAPVAGSQAPAETTSREEEKEPPAAKPSQERPPPLAGQKIVQFSVRGPQHPIRGVIYDPGPQDADPHTYFSAHPDDSGADIVFEFQLLHEK